MGYIIGLIGMWLFCDGIISIRVYLNTVNETGKKIQNWKYDHSIRLIRMLLGIALMIIGGLLYA